MDNLCIISGAQLEKEDGKYWGRFAFVDYLKDISSYFNRVDFFAKVNQGKSRYDTELKSNRVEVHEINYRKELHKPFSFLSGIFRDQRELWKVLSNSYAVFVYYPCSWAVPLLPVIWIRGGSYLGYFANDPDEFIQGNDEGAWFPGPLKRNFYRFSHRLSLVGMDGVIARGKGTYQKMDSYDKPLFETQPLIGFTEADIYDRKDTGKGDTIRLLYVGGLYRRKGLKFLIEAVDNIINDHGTDHDWHLKIVGEGGEKHRLEQIIKDNGIEDRVDFLGYVDDKEKLLGLYRSSDIFVLPSLSGEGFPRVLDEAMASGLPVVTTKSGSIGEELKDKKEALLVEQKNSNALKDAILELVNNGNLRRKLKENGKHRFKQEVGTGAARQHAEIIKGVRGKG